ncbi:MAG: diaminopimelate decarboxylase [Gaiellaceae bacterium]
MLELLPDTALVDRGVLSVGGCRTTDLADEYGTPLVVYCERTIRARAEAYRRAAPAALVAYGTKAFPNIAILRLLVEEGLGADVSTLGELTFALRAEVPPERIVVHGNNKSDAELLAAAEAEVGLLVLDAPDEPARAAEAGVRRVLVRVTPGIEAETHESIRTAHHGSKFGLPPESAIRAIVAARDAGLDAAGLHVHLGSQLLDGAASLAIVGWLGGFAARAREELDWVPAVIDLGGGLGIAYTPEQQAPETERYARALLEELERSWTLHDLPRPQLVLEPGRSLVGQAAVTLYEVGTLKVATEAITWAAIDGGMSDNPRPQLYGARLSALLANRADEEAAGGFGVVGKHCESGDVLIERAVLPEPRRGDLLAVPATGAYTLAMASNYNSVPRPAAVVVAGGDARLIRRRETVDDLLRFEE